MATSRQIAKIWGAAREVLLDKEAVHDLAEMESGVRSVSRLSFQQASNVIDALVRLGATGGTGGGAKKPSGRRKLPGEVQMITGEQQTMIAGLRDQLSGNWKREEYFAGACKKCIHRSAPVTAGQAAIVIEMLKRSLARQKGA